MYMYLQCNHSIVVDLRTVDLDLRRPTTEHSQAYCDHQAQTNMFHGEHAHQILPSCTENITMM